ncbi:MAG: phosphomannose isomerase type II C-terminal cupin domain [Acidobacteriota bacterium]|nr:phosphomannose isomerase type II C-terminal cupin domain [Acidobacteriota bacterium]
MKESISLESIEKLIYEEERPWGKFRRYPHQIVSSLKIITVNPGGWLSLQYHRRRSEYWVVLDSGLEVTLGSRSWQPKPGEEIFIPANTPHRLKSSGSQPARILELWFGSSDENDLVRVEDAYGRD